ncbi:O-antigen polymerase [Desulfobacca acetoxidans]|uniref:Oligosaccharide repeat unit polymerase n=1 Tax=Desulfobacca acetoxidans (strain ATCC 700848 / DSM 11109 / ASRB2) TaxID=880072 RepID=F2NIK0_DESAR|nr:O-antigen polymerase [Desulfobacca acetoxidans]AEB10475.1 hypothetical protein Desac_2660 [Desulfobacca acetoxidans DSM 11109]
MLFFDLLIIILNCVLSAYFALKRVRQGNITFLYYGLNLFFLGIPNLFSDYFNIDYKWFLSSGITYYVFDINTRIFANIINIIVLLSFYFGEQLMVKRNIFGIKMPNFAFSYNIKFISILKWLSLFFAIIGFVLLFSAKGVSFSEVSTLFSAKMRMQHKIPESWIGAVLGAQLLSFLMVYNYISLYEKRRIYFIIGVFLVFAIIASTGTRSYFLFFLGPFFYYYIKNYKLTNNQLFLLFGFFIFAPFVSEIIRQWRYSEVRNIKSLFDVLSKLDFELFMSYPVSEINNYVFSLYNAVNLYPASYDWLYGNTYINILFFWLPSGTLPGFKIDTIYYFADAVLGITNSYIDRISMHPSFPGDCYINFGYFFFIPAFIWGIIYGILYLAGKTNKIIEIIAGATSGMYLVYLFRGSIYYGLFQIISIILFVFSCYIILYIGHYIKIRT